MSWQATECVRRLKGVNRGEKAVLYTLAAHHRWSSGLCCPRIPEIAADAEMSERHVIRLLQGLVERGVLERERPLDGRGAFTYYNFPGLVKGDILPAQRVTFSTSKGDIHDRAIRKKQNLVTQEPIPSPDPSLPRAGDEAVWNSGRHLADRVEHARQRTTLTVRQVRHLNQEIYLAMNDPQVDFDTALETACARLLIPLDEARGVARAAGLEGKKEPQRALG